MKLLSKCWKLHSAMLISLSLVLAGCGGSGGAGSDSGKGSGSNTGADNSIPDNTTGSTGSGSDTGTGSVADNSNTTTLPTGDTSGVEIFVDTNNAIDDLSLLDAGGVPTFGKKSKGKSLKGQAKDIDKLWAVQYTEAGVIEKVYPMSKVGSKYTISADLSDSRGYKFVFFGYENERWTADPTETYTGPTEATEDFGALGGTNTFNGVSFGGAAISFLNLTDDLGVKAVLAGVTGTLATDGVTVEAKTAGLAGNSIKVNVSEAVKPTYWVGMINNGLGAAAHTKIKYRTIAGVGGNINIRFKRHDLAEFPLFTQPASEANVLDPDFAMDEFSVYEPSTNTFTIHYGPATNLQTVAFILGASCPAIERADVCSNVGVIAGFGDLVAPNDTVLPEVVTSANPKLNQTEALLNFNNGDLGATGNENGDPASVTYNAGNSTLFVKVKSEHNLAAASPADVFYVTTYVAAGQTHRTPAMATSVGTIVSTVADMMKAYADALPGVRDLVNFIQVGDATSLAVLLPAATTNLTSGVNPSGSAAVSNFDKNTNPSFVWSDALGLFNVDSLFPSVAANYTIGLRTGSSFTPNNNRVAFDNFYKNFTYFGILHLEDTDISAKKSKTVVEAKIVSAQSYRQEGNIGPAVYLIENDTFTLGAPTGEVILHIRNYYNSDISLDDLRITASIKDANLDSDSGKVSVALKVPTTGTTLDQSWFYSAANGFLPNGVGTNPVVVNDLGALVFPALVAESAFRAAPYRATAAAATAASGTAILDVFPAITSSTATALFPHADVLKQDYTLTKKSRTEFVRAFQWEDDPTIPALSQKADTDTIVYEFPGIAVAYAGAAFNQNQDKGRDVKESFVTRAGLFAVGPNGSSDGSYVPTTAGEFIDIDYHLYYRPRSAVGTDTILVFIEDGTRDPTGYLQDPRETGLISTNFVTETRSPSVGLDGTIIPYAGSDKDLIYNTLSLEIPVDTVVIDADSALEEPDATTSFSIVFDAVSSSGSTAGQTENDPSTMTVAAQLINEQAGETYTYRWNWSRYFELDGDNAFIGMPDGAFIRGLGKHQVTFSDATGLHPDFTSVKVTIRASAGLDPEGTIRPFDPSTFNPTVSLTENVDRDYVFLDNYDAGADVVNMSTVGFKAAVKLDLTTDATEAHLIVTPKTNSAGEIIASGAEIAEAIRYYLLNANKILVLQAVDASFSLMTVYSKGTTADAVPYMTTIISSDVDGKVFSGGRTADDNAGSTIELGFANSEDYLNVRDTGSPVLSVTILDTVPEHNGSTFIVNLSNAYPPVINGTIGTISDVTYSFVSLSSDGITASSKRSKANNEIFLSVADDTDADGAVTFITRVKRDNAGENDSYKMQDKAIVVDGAAIGAPSTRENQFVGYWDVRRISAQSTVRLKAPGNSNVNDWVMAEAVDFVGSGADGNTDPVLYNNVYTAIYNAAIVDTDEAAEANNQAKLGATAGMNGINVANGNNLVLRQGLLSSVPAAGITSNTAAGGSFVTQRAIILPRAQQATLVANQAYVPLAGQATVANMGTATAAINTAMPAAAGVTGLGGEIFNGVIAANGIVAPAVVGVGGGWHRALHVAKAAIDSFDDVGLDDVAKAHKLATYNAIYTAVYNASIVDGDTVAQAVGQATFQADVASYGGTVANLTSAIGPASPGYYGLFVNSGAGVTSQTAGTAALTARIAVISAKVNANANTAITQAGFVAPNPAAVLAVLGPAVINGAHGLRHRIYNAVFGVVLGSNAAQEVLADQIATAACASLGNVDMDYRNGIPTEARIFNQGLKSDSGQHDATLANDPDDPTNVDLQHLLFNTRLILPTAAAARDAYFVRFRFRPGVALSAGTQPIMTNEFIITVTE